MTYYQKILAVVAVAIFYTNVPQYAYIHHGFAVPKYWVSGLCLLALPLLIRQMSRADIPKSPLIIWCFGYAWLTVIWFFLSSQSDVAWQEVRMRFLTILQIISFLMIFGDRDTTRLARKVVVAAVLFSVALNIYELFVGKTFSEVLGRSAGLYMNPNMAGEALVLGMIVGATILPSWCQGPFILVTGIGVFTTFSRGGMLAWVIGVAGLIYRGRIGLKDLLRSGFLALVLVVMVLLPRWEEILTAVGKTGVSNKDVQERLEWFTNPSGVDDASGWSRKYVAQQAWMKFADHPWIGSGTGTSYEAFAIPPHNQYLTFMVDHGFLGAAVLPLLVLTLTWGAQGESKCVAMVFGCTVIVASLFTHTLVEVPYALLLFALVGAMASGCPSHKITDTKSIEAGQLEVTKSLLRA